MQKDVQEIMRNIAAMDRIRDAIEVGNSIDCYRDDIASIIDEYMDVLLNAKVKI